MEFIESNEKQGKVNLPPKKTATGIARAVGRLLNDAEFKGKVSYYTSEKNEVILQRL
jgi:hypothetical protein